MACADLLDFTSCISVTNLLCAWCAPTANLTRGGSCIGVGTCDVNSWITNGAHNRDISKCVVNSGILTAKRSDYDVVCGDDGKAARWLVISLGLFGAFFFFAACAIGSKLLTSYSYKRKRRLPETKQEWVQRYRSGTLMSYVCCLLPLLGLIFVENRLLYTAIWCAVGLFSAIIVESFRTYADLDDRTGFLRGISFKSISMEKGIPFRAPRHVHEFWYPIYREQKEEQNANLIRDKDSESSSAASTTSSSDDDSYVGSRI